MSKFCIKCGQNIQEGPCGCNVENQQAEIRSGQDESAAGTDSVNINKSQQNVDVNKLVNDGLSGVVESKDIVLKMIKSPVTTFLDAIKVPNMKVGVTFILAYALLWGFIALGLVKKIATLTSDIFGGAMSGLGFGGMMGIYDTMIGDIFPKQKIFFFTFFGVILQAAIIIGLLMIVNSFFKGKANYKSVTTMVGISLAPSFVFVVLAIVAFLISFNLAVYVAAIGLMVSLILVFLGTKEVLNMDSDKVIYVVPLIYIVNNIIILLYTKEAMKSIVKSMATYNFW